MVSWKIKERALRPIGLDIGHNSIKMLQLAVNTGSISVRAAKKIPIDARVKDDPKKKRDFVVSSVAQALQEENFSEKRVVSCLPNSQLQMANLRIPLSEENDIKKILRKEAYERFGFDENNDEMNYLVAGSIHQGNEIKNEVILFTVKGEMIRDHIGMLEEAGLQPTSLDIAPYALFRSFERPRYRVHDKEETVVFIDVGNVFTTAVFGRAGEIIFIKQIPIGVEHFNQHLADKLGISTIEAQRLRSTVRIAKAAGNNSNKVESAEVLNAADNLDNSMRQAVIDAVGSIAEDLARELSLCFRYYTVTFRGKRVGRTVLAGGGAYENVLFNVLKRQLTVELELASPFKGLDIGNVDFDDHQRGLLSEWAIAVGLALKGCKLEKRKIREENDHERN